MHTPDSLRRSLAMDRLMNGEGYPVSNEGKPRRKFLLQKPTRKGGSQMLTAKQTLQAEAREVHLEKVNFLARFPSNYGDTPVTKQTKFDHRIKRYRSPMIRAKRAKKK